jgi:prephenate dehydrogenase
VTALKWNRVTVVGCGLIGASFALALKESGACERVAGWDASQSVLDEALDGGIIDEVDQSFAAHEASAAELLYLATPIKATIGFFQKYGLKIRQGVTITDAGSTKTEVCRAALEHLPQGPLFIGGHPVAGSHHSGLSYARADLFKDAPYVLIGNAEEKDSRFIALKETIAGIGARIELMTAQAHDSAMALVSHLPQLLSSALAATIKSQTDANHLLNLSATGYRDMSRLAASSWQMWRDVLLTNPAPIAGALSALIERLAQIRDELEDCCQRGEIDLALTKALFEQAQRA